MNILTQTLTIKEGITIILIFCAFFEFGFLYGICKFIEIRRR